MAGNRFFFFVLCVYFGFLSNQIVFFFVFFFTFQNSYFKGLLSLTVVNSNRPSFFQLVTMIDLYTFRSAAVYLYFSSYSGKHFTDKTTERSNTRSRFVFRRITLFFSCLVIATVLRWFAFAVYQCVFPLNERAKNFWFLFDIIDIKADYYNRWLTILYIYCHSSLFFRHPPSV